MVHPEVAGGPCLVEHDERRVFVVDVHVVLDAAFLAARGFGEGCERGDQLCFATGGGVNQGEDGEGHGGLSCIDAQSSGFGIFVNIDLKLRGRQRKRKMRVGHLVVFSNQRGHG